MSMRAVENLANRLWPYRRRLFAASALFLVLGVVLALLLSLITLGRIRPALPVAVFLIPAWTSWSLLLIAVWFHPQFGRLRRQPHANQMVRGAIAAVRVWSVLFLLIFQLTALCAPVLLIGVYSRSNPPLQRTGTSVATLPLAPAAERPSR